MITDKEIEAIIAAKIEADENIGESAGGSGHMSFVSYELDWYDYKEHGENTEINFKYTVFTETEFTNYPDNPPYKEKYHKQITIDMNDELIGETEKQICNDITDDDWQKAQEAINAFIEGFLSKIEWHYGENRAPVRYPPKYYIDDLDPFRPYVCEFEDDDGNPIRLSSSGPMELLDYIKEDLPARFNMFF